MFVSNSFSANKYTNSFLSSITQGFIRASTSSFRMNWSFLFAEKIRSKPQFWRKALAVCMRQLESSRILNSNHKSLRFHSGSSQYLAFHILFKQGQKVSVKYFILTIINYNSKSSCLHIMPICYTFSHFWPLVI